MVGGYHDCSGKSRGGESRGRMEVNRIEKESGGELRGRWGENSQRWGRGGWGRVLIKLTNWAPNYNKGWLIYAK